MQQGDTDRFQLNSNFQGRIMEIHSSDDLAVSDFKICYLQHINYWDDKLGNTISAMIK